MLLFLRRHYGEIHWYHNEMFFSAVSMRAAIFKATSFSEIYLHYGVFNRGTNLVSV